MGEAPLATYLVGAFALLLYLSFCVTVQNEVGKKFMTGIPLGLTITWVFILARLVITLAIWPIYVVRIVLHFKRMRS